MRAATPARLDVALLDVDADVDHRLAIGIADDGSSADRLERPRDASLRRVLVARTVAKACDAAAGETVAANGLPVQDNADRVPALGIVDRAHAGDVSLRPDDPDRIAGEAGRRAARAATKPPTAAHVARKSRIGSVRDCDPANPILSHSPPIAWEQTSLRSAGSLPARLRSAYRPAPCSSSATARRRADERRWEWSTRSATSS